MSTCAANIITCVVGAGVVVGLAVVVDVVGAGVVVGTGVVVGLGVVVVAGWGVVLTPLQLSISGDTGPLTHPLQKIKIFYWFISEPNLERKVNY